MSDLDEICDAILNLLADRGALTRPEIVADLEISRSTIGRRLEQLLHTTPPRIEQYTKRVNKEGSPMVFYRLVK